METEQVIHAFTKSRNISKSSAVTSSVLQVLIENNLETWFLEQLEKSPPKETRNPFQDKFEDRLRKIY